MFGIIITTKKNQVKRDMAMFIKGLACGHDLALRTLERMNKPTVLSQAEQILKDKGE